MYYWSFKCMYGWKLLSDKISSPVEKFPIVDAKSKITNRLLDSGETKPDNAEFVLGIFQIRKILIEEYQK